MSSFDIKQVDPGVRKLVRFLRSNGYNTTDSGDGVSKEDIEGALDIPHVFMTVDADEGVRRADKLRRLLIDSFGIESCQDSVVEFSYNPDDLVGVLSLYYLDDRLFDD